MGLISVAADFSSCKAFTNTSLTVLANSSNVPSSIFSLSQSTKLPISFFSVSKAPCSIKRACIDVQVSSRLETKPSQVFICSFAAPLASRPMARKSAAMALRPNLPSCSIFCIWSAVYFPPVSWANKSNTLTLRSSNGLISSIESLPLIKPLLMAEI